MTNSAAGYVTSLLLFCSGAVVQQFSAASLVFCPESKHLRRVTDR